MSSSLTSWWGSSKPEPKNPLELVPVNNTRSSIALTDSVRKITSSCLAPTGHLAVTADELGRGTLSLRIAMPDASAVLLLDVRLNVVCRMWKGYRDAQCGWLFGCSQDEPSNQVYHHSVQRHAAYAKHRLRCIWLFIPHAAAFSRCGESATVIASPPSVRLRASLTVH